jgi:hypothetical protein
LGDNGQQLVVLLPTGTTKVRISGFNQNSKNVQWDGVAGILNASTFAGNFPGGFGAVTTGWWWKYKVDIWYNDSAGTTHYLEP